MEFTVILFYTIAVIINTMESVEARFEIKHSYDGLSICDN